MVDYSKWDKFVDSSDEDSDNDYHDSDSDSDSLDDHRPKPTFGGMRPLPIVNGTGKFRSRTGKYRYLDWAVEDTAEGVPPVFFTNPEEFVPQIDPDTGKIARTWGICLGPDGGYWIHMRKMTTQFIYLEHGKPPEKQFVKVLKSKKAAKLASPEHMQLRQQLATRDYILTVYLDFIEPKIYRKFKVSGGTNLLSFADKILGPIVGWTRNYHSYVFVDLSDGAVFGPKQSRSIDIMHLDTRGWLYLNVEKYLICDVLQTVGAEMGYLYDLGDGWSHTIVLEEILDADKSNGKVQVLEGARACPPEDSNGFEGMGNWAYRKALKKNTINYNEASSALNYRPKRFHPETFSVQQCQERVNTELRSTTSTLSGAKLFNFPLTPAGITAFDSSRTKNPKTEAHVKQHQGDSSSYLSETVRTSRDHAQLALCHKCGSPHNLKVCSACRGIRYCSRECQVSDWAAHKPLCKPVQK